MTHATHRHARDERGATAILVGILAIVLFGIGAFAVDIGQAYAKRSLEQTSVDLAVMAAAAELSQASGCNEAVVQTATDFLHNKLENQVPGQPPTINLGGSFGDGDGFIACPGNWKVRLEAPASRVDFTLGRVISPDGPDHVDVAAEATAQVKSPGQSSTLPMYAVAGCDSGYQDLTDPPPGPPPAAVVPDLTPDSSPNTVTDLNIVSPNPNEVPADSVAPVPMTLKGKGLVGTTAEVWFTTADGGHQAANDGSPLTADVSGQNFTINVPTVPQTVLDTDGIWYVRVFNDGKFSAEAGAQPLVIGDLLFCDGMVSGNFGTLKISRSNGNSSTWLQDNLIKGIEPTLQINASNAVPCSPIDSQSNPPTWPTDCVATDPGFPNEAATDGLVTGSSTAGEGRLKRPTAPGCDRNGGSNPTQTSPPLNDDVLACYITGGHSVGDVVAGTENILSGDIYKSPRFFQVPVIPVQAANGFSSYPIIDFRPGFITTEPLSSTAAARGSVTGHNGVEFHANHVKKLSVLFFPEAALPETAAPIGGEIDYTGHGTKVLVLVD